MSSRDDVEAEEVVNNPEGAANDPGETFDLIRHYFDRKFDSLKTEIIAETHLAEESSRKRKFEDIEFKSKSNKVQFRFNCEIIDLIERAESSAKLKGNRRFGRCFMMTVFVKTLLLRSWNVVMKEFTDSAEIGMRCLVRKDSEGMYWRSDL